MKTADRVELEALRDIVKRLMAKIKAAVDVPADVVLEQYDDTTPPGETI